MSNTRQKILIIDDSPNILRAYKSILGRDYSLELLSGDKIVHGRNSINSFDLLLMEIHFKDIGIHKLLSLIRGEDPTIPIVVITGYSEELKDIDFRPYNITHFFVKPPDINELRVTVKSLLNQGEER